MSACSGHVARTLVILGDSIVAGWGVAHDESYPAILENLLNGGAQGAPLWRVISAGVPGDTVVQGCARYKHDVAAHEPHVVLIAFGLNDGALRRTVFDVQRERSWRAGRSLGARVWQRLGRLVRWGRGKPCVSEVVTRWNTPRVGRRVFCAALSDLILRVKRVGALVGVLTLTPVVLGSHDQVAMYAQYNKLIRKVARRHRALLVDLECDIGDTFDPLTMLSQDGIHLTASGQHWLARVVYYHLTKASAL